MTLDTIEQQITEVMLPGRALILMPMLVEAEEAFRFPSQEHQKELWERQAVKIHIHEAAEQDLALQQIGLRNRPET